MPGNIFSWDSSGLCDNKWANITHYKEDGIDLFYHFIGHLQKTKIYNADGNKDFSVDTGTCFSNKASINFEGEWSL